MTCMRPSCERASRAIDGAQRHRSGPGEDVAYVEMIAELAITMAPVMEEQGVIAPGRIDPATSDETCGRRWSGSKRGDRTLGNRRLVAHAVRRAGAVYCAATPTFSSR